MRWLMIFVLFADGTTDWQVIDLHKSGMSCEMGKALSIERIKYGDHQGKVVSEAWVECFDTVGVQ